MSERIAGGPAVATARAPLQHKVTTFNRQLRELLELNSDFLRRLPITEHSYFALQTLSSAANSEPLKVGELARLLALSSSATTELVNRLCARGWSERIEMEGDRRAVGVRITAEGESLLASLIRAQQANLRRNQRQLDALVRSLTILLPQIASPTSTSGEGDREKDVAAGAA